MNEFKMKALASEGNKTAKLVTYIREKFDRALITVLIGYNALSVIIATISTIIFMHIFGNMFDSTIVSLIASIIMAVIVYLFGDTIPKLIGKATADSFVKFAAYPLAFFMIILFPITYLFELLIKLLKKLTGADKVPSFTEEDLTDAVEQIEKEGDFSEKESDIIQATLDFDDTRVKEILTPKEKMFAVDIKDIKKSNLLNILNSTSYSRIPVYKNNPSHIVGVLNSKICLTSLYIDPNTSVDNLIQKPYFVTSNMTIEKILEGFKEHKTHIAFVNDKNNKVIGMITMDDVIDELIEDDGGNTK